MKILKISLKILLLVIAVAAIGVIVVTSLLRKAGLPDLSGDEKIAGLVSEVRILRDGRGVPHIYASNTHDLYFVTGYVTAQDRLWQMDMVRHATQGRLSEMFKRDMTDTDLFLRALRIPEKSKLVLEKEDPVILEILQAYTDGVNTWIKERGKKLPAEFRLLGYQPEPWTMVDITNIIGFIGWDLASANLSSEINNYKRAKKLGFEKATELIPDWNIVDNVVYPDFNLGDNEVSEALKLISSVTKAEDMGAYNFSGSNNWAVSGARSETGKPILSNDMHMGLTVPGNWIQIHQIIPGELNVTGVVFPGEPFVIAGHNEKIAWGLTNLYVDDIDLFVEKTDSSGNNYLYNGAWLPFSSRDEVIKTGGDSAKMRTVRYSHHGPVISGMRGIDDAVLTMKWSGFDYSDEIKAVYLLNRAKNWDDFRTALSHFRSISQNFAYADIDGNIGMQAGGGIPVRKGSGVLPRRGDTTEYEWQGYVPYEEMPSSYNPAEGFVSSANNRTVTSGYPFYIGGNYDLPYRIMRIREMASEKEKLGIDDFKRMVTDNHSAYAAMLTPVIIKVADKITDPDETEKKAIDVLKKWDYSMNAGLVAPTLFEFIRMELARNIMSDEMSDLYGSPLGRQYDFYIYQVMKKGPDEWIDNVNTPEKENLDDIISLSVRSALDTLTARYGGYGDKWKWGKIHTMTFEHPMGGVKVLNLLLGLNSRTYGVGGSYHTVEPFAFNEAFRSYHGASERHIFNTANWDKSLTVIPTGTSGIPGSPFYLSQTKTYMNNEFYSDPFTEEAVQAAKKYEMILRPTAGR